MITLSQLKPGQRITYNGNPATYLGVRTVKAKIGRVSKIIIKEDGGDHAKLPVTDGPRTLESLNIKLADA